MELHATDLELDKLNLVQKLNKLMIELDQLNEEKRTLSG
jgi:hypothetical protein